MCTIICTMRTVLWYVMSIVGTLLILVAMFTNKWLEGSVTGSNFSNGMDTLLKTGENIAGNIAGTIGDGEMENPFAETIGLFQTCQKMDRQLFQGECFPTTEYIEELFTELDDTKYPHAWRGAVVCFALGEALMVITVFFGLLTVCCRRCICCSVFTICGSIQSFAGILFTLGLIAYPAGWGSTMVQATYCGDTSGPFMLGTVCKIGIAFWLAVAGTVCTVLASSLAIWAYQSTRSSKAEEAQDQGEHCICLV